QPTAKVVAATVPTVAVVTWPSITGTPTVDAAVVADGGRWSPADVRLSYQWAVGGKPVKGATRSSYTPTAGDLGKSLTVTVTAARSGYAAASVVTAAKKVVAGAPPRSVKPPTISGKAKVGSRLTAKPGTWSPSSVRTSFQWLANGKSIKGATKSTYTPRTTDVGKKLSVRVTATRAGHRTAVATSKATVAVPKVAPKVRAKLSRTTASTSSRVVVTVTVTATGVKAPTGVVTVRYGSKSVKAKVTSSKHGKVTVTLPRLRKGSYAVTATFAPSGSTGKVVSSAKAKAGTLRIR
ncbi:MAG TPA: Ig-like domain repeat protein, partial [Cellulomonas sp.]|nr:Ig-like domain repeat protein [Cellulomonas sp.]